MTDIYVSIGNSDDRLTQVEWSEFVREIDLLVPPHQRFGTWFSAPGSRYQNACWGFHKWTDDMAYFKRALANTARRYQQDSIAWAEAETEFL